jgi:hypothetical protein
MYEFPTCFWYLQTIMYLPTYIGTYIRSWMYVGAILNFSNLVLVGFDKVPIHTYHVRLA